MENHNKPISNADCDKYDHIPELYDVAFWHCKICGEELHFYSESELDSIKQHAITTQQTAHESETKQIEEKYLKMLESISFSLELFLEDKVQDRWEVLSDQKDGIERYVEAKRNQLTLSNKDVT